MPDSVVMDASAVLAVFYGEPGSDVVIELLRGALLSTVNLAEVHAKLLKDGAAARQAWNRLMDLGCEICVFDDEQARLAAEMAEQTRPFGLSLGDRACLALALQRKARAYTADRAWKGLPVEVEIEVIR